MDISLLIVVERTASYRPGDIVNISLMTTEECTANRCALINITGIPDRAPAIALLRRVKRMLEASNGVIRGTPPRRVMLRRRAWSVRDVSANVRNKILNDRKIDVTWQQIKGHIKKRFINVEDDDSQDTFVTIKDEDL